MISPPTTAVPTDPSRSISNANTLKYEDGGFATANVSKIDLLFLVKFAVIHP